MDTSALVAIIAREPDRENYIAALAREDAKFTAPLVILEAKMVLSSRLQVEPQTAFAHLIDLLKSAHVEITPIEAEHAVLAMQAFATYGEGTPPGTAESCRLPQLRLCAAGGVADPLQGQ